jgi:hypothetical protein
LFRAPHAEPLAQSHRFKGLLNMEDVLEFLKSPPGPSKHLDPPPPPPPPLPPSLSTIARAPLLIASIPHTALATPMGTCWLVEAAV